VIVAIDIGHGKHTADLGARTLEGGWERDLVRLYVDEAVRLLDQLGVDVHRTSGSGDYSHRIALAYEAGARAWIQCHLDAGQLGTPYGGAYWRWDRELDATLATALCHALGRIADPGRTIASACAAGSAPRPTGWGVTAWARATGWSRPWSCLVDVPLGMAGIIYEPATVDRSEHSQLRADPRPIGQALAAGIAAWIESRQESTR
jgi:hypothetical protein